MNPFLVGFWDGTNVWVQWDPIPDVREYEVRLRFRKKGEPQWEDWRPTIKVRQVWTIYPSNRLTGTEVQAEVRLVWPGEAPEPPVPGEWARATPAKFVRSRCLFEFSSTRSRIHYVEGVMIHCHVDGAACSYRLTEEIEVHPGETKQVELEAVASSGFAQLDEPGDFEVRPGLGIVIRNIAPSHSDLEPLLSGRDFAVVEVAPRDGPVTLAFLRPEVVQ